MKIPEICYRVRVKIYFGVVDSVCFMRSDVNPADALTKQRPNKKIAASLERNKCTTPCEAVFMLQDSQYLHLDWIRR